MSTSTLQYALWVLPVVVQLAIAVALFRRRLHFEYPFFFAYTLFQVVAFSVQYTLYHVSYAAYFYAFWAIGLGSVLLGFAVINEIFTHAFRPYEGLRELGATLFHWAAMVLVLVTAVIAASGSGTFSSQLVTAIFTFERSVRVMQVGLLVFLFLFSDKLGLSWRHQIFGIALGFGIFASVELTLATLLSQFGAEYGPVFSVIKAAAYCCSVALWMVYSVAPQPARQQVQLAPQIEKWRVAFAAAPNPAGQDGFVSSVERTVERVLNKAELNGGLKMERLPDPVVSHEVWRDR